MRLQGIRRTRLRRSAGLAAPALACLLVLLPLAFVPPTSALGPSAQSSTFTLGLVPVFTGLDRPVFITHAGDGTNRLFIVEQTGRIRVAVNGVLQADPFLDLTAIVNTFATEQGLLGLAFDPQYATNRRFYVFYSVGSGESGPNTLARYQASTDNPNRADPNSGEVLFAIPDRFNNHNGGMLAFGPDGYLYVGTGDGGGGGDPDNNAQNLDSRLGKILRLDVRGANGYAVPATNPFANAGGVVPRSGPTGSATPGASASIGRRATFGSATWGREAGRRLTSSRPTAAAARTTAGASWRARTASTRTLAARRG